MAKHEPMFVTRSETFKFVAGETIHLPCEVSNAGKSNINWLIISYVVWYMTEKPNIFIAEVQIMHAMTIWYQLKYQLKY